jgi:ribosomal protein S27E
MIDVPCPHCQQHLFFEDSAAGQLGRCSGCNSIVQVPLPEATPIPKQRVVVYSTKTKQREDNLYMRLRCPACKEKLFVSMDKAGQVGPCPRCGRKIRVPPGEPPAAAIVDPTEVAEADYEAAPPPVRRQLYVDAQASARKRGVLPRFIRDGVLVQCPACRGVHRVNDDEYGDRIPCECGADFRVTVPPQGKLFLCCRLCGCKMEIGDTMAGRTISCIDCGEPVTVPSSPITVTLIRRKAPPSSSSSSGTASALLNAAVVLSSLHGGLSHPRRCAICGRSLRNPSAYCYRCWPR